MQQLRIYKSIEYGGLRLPKSMHNEHFDQCLVIEERIPFHHTRPLGVQGKVAEFQCGPNHFPKNV